MASHNSISATSTIQGSKEVFYDAFILIKQSDYFSNAHADAGVSITMT